MPNSRARRLEPPPPNCPALQLGRQRHRRAHLHRIRISKLLGADIEDLGTERGHRVLGVRRRGSKIQALAFPAPAAGRIDAYLADRYDVTALPAIPGACRCRGGESCLPSALGRGCTAPRSAGCCAALAGPPGFSSSR